MFLVDTSVFINYLKGRDTKASRFLDAAVQTDICIASIVYQELLQGARDEDEYETLKSYLGSQFFCDPKDPILTYENAARMYFDARRKGFTIRSTLDCLIAQIAIDNEIPLLHDDKDFEKLAKVSSLKLSV